MENNVQSHNSQHGTHSGKNWYDKYHKWLLLLPLILMLFSVWYLWDFNAKNGDLVYKDVSITGGTTITVFDKNVDITELKQDLISQIPDIQARSISDIRTGEQLAFFIETAQDVESTELILEEYLGYELNTENSSIEFSGASISSGFYQQLRFAIIMAFVLMAVVVFIIFRTPIRSLSIIIAGLFDIIMTIVVIDILGIRLSTAGIVALLMLIGYSVDADILLTTRVVKHKEGTLNQRIWGAFKTGITMTLTAIVAVAIALIFTHSLSAVLSQMFTIILIGLGFDIFNCWITNASILKWYGEAKKL